MGGWPGGKPAESGWSARTAKRMGRGVEDEKAEDAGPFREVTDGVDGGLVEADGDELREAGPVLVDDPQGAVAGVDQGAGHLHDVTEDGRKLDVGLDEEDGVEERLQLVGITDPVIRHARILPSEGPGIPVPGRRVRLGRDRACLPAR